MPSAPSPMSWLTIILILVAVAIGTGVVVGALGYVISLPQWLPGAALGGAIGVSGAVLIARRMAQIDSYQRPPPT